MRVTNHDIPGLPGYELDYTNSTSPWMWYGARAVDGAAAPWSAAPVGSIYWSVVAGICRFYAKVADAGATADWEVLMSSDTAGFATNPNADHDTTYLENLVVTGNLQAGFMLARDSWVGDEELISGPLGLTATPVART
jgi:hypothetical protein